MSISTKKTGDDLFTVFLSRHCAYCVGTKEPVEKYTSHYIMKVNGEISCPKLISEGCPHCKMNGIFTHPPIVCPSLLPSTESTTDAPASLHNRKTEDLTSTDIHYPEKLHDFDKSIRIWLLNGYYLKRCAQYKSDLRNGAVSQAHHDIQNKENLLDDQGDYDKRTGTKNCTLKRNSMPDNECSQHITKTSKALRNDKRFMRVSNYINNKKFLDGHLIRYKKDNVNTESNMSNDASNTKRDSRSHNRNSHFKGQHSNQSKSKISAPTQMCGCFAEEKVRRKSETKEMNRSFSPKCSNHSQIHSTKKYAQNKQQINKLPRGRLAFNSSDFRLKAQNNKYNNGQMSKQNRQEIKHDNQHSRWSNTSIRTISSQPQAEYGNINGPKRRVPSRWDNGNLTENMQITFNNNTALKRRSMSTREHENNRFNNREKKSKSLYYNYDLY